MTTDVVRIKCRELLTNALSTPCNCRFLYLLDIWCFNFCDLHTACSQDKSQLWTSCFLFCCSKNLQPYIYSNLESHIYWTQFFTWSHTNITPGHSWKLQKKQSQYDIRLYFFSQRCINRWNSLSQEAVEAPSINSFKNHLEKIRSQQMDFFMDWSLKVLQVLWLHNEMISPASLEQH